MENLPTLPDEIIFQILSCCSSVETLLRLIRSCKFTRNLVLSHRCFAHYHSHLTLAARQADQVHFMTCSDNTSKLGWRNLEKSALKRSSLSKPFPLYLGEGVYVAGSSNGIIGLYQYQLNHEEPRPTIYLWNPTLHQIRALPQYIKDCERSFIGFGYDSNNQQHKFVCIHSSSHKVDIYSLRNDSWKSITRNCSKLNKPMDFKSVEVNGSLQWLSTENSIIKFGLSDERISELMIPKSVKGRYLGVANGCVSLLNVVKYGNCEIWSMYEQSSDNGESCSWIKKFKFEHLALHNAINFKACKFGHLALQYIDFTTHGKVIAEWKKDVVCYDLETQNYETLGPRERNIYRSVGYVASFISVYPASS